MKKRHFQVDDSFYVRLIFAAVSIIALLVVRGALFYYESFDYIHSLSVWVSRFGEMTFFEGIGTRVGNYNPIYMYILNIIAFIQIPGHPILSDLFLIKFVSVIFDFLTAFFVMKIISLKTESTNLRLLAFILALAIPTVILNSAMWAQSDSIYTAFVIGSLYFAMAKKSKTAFAFIALAVSFKLQAAFMLPIFAVFVFTKKIRIKDIYMFFLVYIATLLPALIAGRPILETLTIYLNQTDTYHFLVLNAPNIWQFVSNVSFENFRIVGLYIAGVAVLALLYFTYVYREKLAECNIFVYTNIVRLSFLFASILPFLLPQMHDRFFFMADVLSVCVFLFDKRRWYVPVITIFSSYLAYHWFLMGYRYLIDLRYASIALGVVIIIVLRDYVTALNGASCDRNDDLIG